MEAESGGNLQCRRVCVCVWKRVSEIQLPQPYERPEKFGLASRTLAWADWSPPTPVGEDVESGQHPSSSSSSRGGHRSLSKCYIQDVVCIAQHVDELGTWADRL